VKPKQYWTFKMPDSTNLSLNIRYQMAWTEVTTRIAQRQNALYLYILITGAILGYAGQGITNADSLHNTSKQADTIFGQHADVAMILTLLFALVGVPLIGIVFAILNRKHEGTIRILREYLQICEKYAAIPATPTGSSASPQECLYNSNPIFRQSADGYRNYHDIVFAISIACTTLAAIAIAWHRYYSLDGKTIAMTGNLAGFIIYAVALLFCGVLAIAIIYYPYRKNSHLYKQEVCT
jgi:hypothetical protein